MTLENDTQVKSENRTGNWTKADLKFMEENHLSMSIADIAAQLQRNPETVAQYIKKRLGYTEHEKYSKKATFDIQKSPTWKNLIKQFSPDELDTFVYNWGNLMAQFKYDVLPSERMQLIEVCRLEAIINRISEKLYEVDILVKGAQAELDEQRLKPIEERDMSRIGRLEVVISTCNTSHREMTREFKELLERKDTILKSMRATREQRIKQILDNKETIQTWMAKIVDDQDLRKSLGIEMRKQQLAMEVELARLSDYHTYADGSLEQPILSAETIKEDNV